MFAAWFTAGVALGGAVAMLIMAFVQRAPTFDPDPEGPLPFGKVLAQPRRVL